MNTFQLCTYNRSATARLRPRRLRLYVRLSFLWSLVWLIACHPGRLICLDIAHLTISVLVDHSQLIADHRVLVILPLMWWLFVWLHRSAVFAHHWH